MTLRQIGSPEQEQVRRRRMTARRLGQEAEMDALIIAALRSGGRSTRGNLTQLIADLDAAALPEDSW